MISALCDLGTHSIIKNNKKSDDVTCTPCLTLKLSAPLPTGLYVLVFMMQWPFVTSLYKIRWLVFVMQGHFILWEVRTQFVNIILAILRLQGRSVSIVCVRTKATEFVVCFIRLQKVKLGLFDLSGPHDRVSKRFSIYWHFPLISLLN